jgi:carboxypeptidase PM20D1
MSHVSETVNDPRVKVTRFGAFASEPSFVSDINGAGFQIIQRTIRGLFPEVLVAPALVIGGTDSRHYAKLTNNIYRFSPQRLRPDDVKRVHGLNERISVEDYARCVKFYYHLIRGSQQ